MTAMVNDGADVEPPPLRMEEGSLCRVAVLLDPVMLLSVGPKDRAELRSVQWAK